MLIINADDFGGHRLATDRIVDCFTERAITSATAMVHMADSERAAELALEHQLPVGLHLNLTEPFDGDSIPEGVHLRQARIARVLADPRTRRFGLRPALLSEMRAAVEDQLERFRTIYRREPTHIDGHQHVHLNPSVLLSLPREFRVRPGSECEGRLGRPLRRLRTAALDLRHGTVSRMFALETLHPALGGAGLDRVLELARRRTVEIMVHPDRAGDWQALTDPQWRHQLAGTRLGSYAELERG
jgi:predicted glycoside hydrolase/deacetylase ChbG (UPF0249 family)